MAGALWWSTPAFGSSVSATSTTLSSQALLRPHVLLRLHQELLRPHRAAALFDMRVIDGIVNGAARWWVVGTGAAWRFDGAVMDGAVNGLATAAQADRHGTSRAADRPTAELPAFRRGGRCAPRARALRRDDGERGLGVLTWIVFLPLLGVVACALLPKDRPECAAWVALGGDRRGPRRWPCSWSSASTPTGGCSSSSGSTGCPKPASSTSSASTASRCRSSRFQHC